MNQAGKINWQVVLAQRPTGFPDAHTFAMKQTAIPAAGPGEMLLRTEYLSLDPYLRLLMDEGNKFGFVLPLGEPIIGTTVSRVMVSKKEGFQEGDFVLGQTSWQDYAVSMGEGLTNMGVRPEKPSWALGVLGIPGLTAYGGLLQIGRPQPGETVVTAAATGGVGSVVGQIATLKGARAVGIASGKEKCRVAVEELGFDACIDRLAQDFEQQLAAACPKGIDVYFEMAGGRVLKAVLPLLNSYARIPLCGAASQYNVTEKPQGPDTADDMMRLFQVKQVQIEGFQVFEKYAGLYQTFARDMTEWIKQGKVLYREYLVPRLKDAPEAFRGMLMGRNIGKTVVRVNEDAVADK